MIVQAAGYEMEVFTFGGLSIMGLLEAGGDVDFVGVMDVEPDPRESSEIISRLSREMRRLGLKTSAVPRARIPVIKADRVSRALPGTPLHAVACTGMFHFSRSLSPDEQDSFASRIRTNYHAHGVEWNTSHQFATVTFETTADLVAGITAIRAHHGVEIPLRLPVDPRNGPEIYRFPFDLCLASTGLRNSYLIGEYLSMYTYSRHLLLLLKRWGRSSGIVNPMDGFLASYGLTVMFTHFLIKMGVIPKVSVHRPTEEPQLLPKDPPYRSLENGHDPVTADYAKIGYLLAAFFEYYGRAFDYDTQVVCTTNVNLLKKQIKWDKSPGEHTGRPPYFNFSIKDPYGLDNIGRNLSPQATKYVQEAHRLALKSLLRDLDTDPSFVIKDLVSREAPKPRQRTNEGIAAPSELPQASALVGAEAGVSTEFAEQADARYVLKKVEFSQRRAAMERFGERTANVDRESRAAQSVTRSVVSWLRSDASDGQRGGGK
jgi:hypothetical protein